VRATVINNAKRNILMNASPHSSAIASRTRFPYSGFRIPYCAERIPCFAENHSLFRCLGNIFLSRSKRARFYHIFRPNQPNIEIFPVISLLAGN
jgi:hypothetical protein